MEYEITLKQDHDGYWFGYTNGEYIDGSCDYVKLWCKHKIKKSLKRKKKHKPSETYTLKI